MNISAKRATLPVMSSARRLHYEGVIYRFKFLMIATLLCASLTVIGFILGQVTILHGISLHIHTCIHTHTYIYIHIYTFTVYLLTAGNSRGVQ